MKKEIDFSKAVRGKFYRAGATANLPIYLEKGTQAFVEGIARKKKTDISTIVNRLLKADMEVVRTAD